MSEFATPEPANDNTSLADVDRAVAAVAAEIEARQ